MGVEEIFKWCLTKGRGRKHRGVRKIKPDIEEGRNHIEKALHNLRAMEHNIKGDFTDWAVSAAFYAMYHSLLAILYKLGYESRNQKCTINTVEHFIRKGKIRLDLKYIAMIKSADELMGTNAKTLREEFQYGTLTKVNKEVLNELKNNAKEFVEATQVAFEEMKA